MRVPMWERRSVPIGSILVRRVMKYAFLGALMLLRNFPLSVSTICAQMLSAMTPQDGRMLMIAGYLMISAMLVEIPRAVEWALKYQR